MRKIRITMNKDGQTRLEVLGDSGEHCLEFTRELERRLGSVEGERGYKEEFREQESEQEQEGEGER